MANKFYELDTDKNGKLVSNDFNPLQNEWNCSAMIYTAFQSVTDSYPTREVGFSGFLQVKQNVDNIYNGSFAAYLC